MTQDWIKPPPPLHVIRRRAPIAGDRLAKGGAVSCPRPLRTPLQQLAWSAGWWLVWSAWCVAVGVLVGWELAP